MPQFAPKRRDFFACYAPLKCIHRHSTQRRTRTRFQDNMHTLADFFDDEAICSAMVRTRPSLAVHVPRRLRRRFSGTFFCLGISFRSGFLGRAHRRFAKKTRGPSRTDHKRCALVQHSQDELTPEQEARLADAFEVDDDVVEYEEGVTLDEQADEERHQYLGDPIARHALSLGMAQGNAGLTPLGRSRPRGRPRAGATPSPGAGTRRAVVLDKNTSRLKRFQTSVTIWKRGGVGDHEWDGICKFLQTHNRQSILVFSPHFPNQLLATRHHESKLKFVQTFQE